MTLDAMFGDFSRATKAVVEALGRFGDSTFDEARLKLLLKFRNSVIHGGAPDVYDFEKYQRYYETYGDDPLFDLEKITAKCLRSVIFEALARASKNPICGPYRGVQAEDGAASKTC